MKTFRRFGLLLFAALAAATCLGRAQSYFDNVVIVLDASGSMASNMPGTHESKMSAAKAALKAVLQQAPASTRLGVLVFSAANLTNDWLFPLGPRDDAALLPAIDSLVPKNDTPLGRYLKIGADRLLEERTRQFGYGSYRLLVITDGEAQDQPLVNQYTPAIMARGITVDAIGVAMRQDHTLATKVHSYRRVNDAESFKRALREVFGELGSKGGDAAQTEAFQAIAPLPAETAAAMIQALARSGNHPIGATLGTTGNSTPRTGPAQPKPPVKPAPTVAAPVIPPPAPMPPPPSPGSSSVPFGRSLLVAIPGAMCTLIVIFVMAVVIFFIRKGRR